MSNATDTKTTLTTVNKDLTKLWSGVDVEHIIVGAPVEKTMKDSTNKYSQAPISFNYGTAEKPVIDEFKYDGPMMIARAGIVRKPKMDNSTPKKPIPGLFETSLMVSFKRSDQGDMAYVAFRKNLHSKLAKEIAKNPAKFRRPGFVAELAQAMGFKNPVYEPVIKDTTTIDESKNLSQWLKLYEVKQSGIIMRTPFAAPDKKLVAWEDLMNCELKFIPRIHVKGLYANGNLVSIQESVDSVVIVGVKRRGTMAEQDAVIGKLLQENPNIAAEVNSQLDLIRGATASGGNESVRNEASDAKTAPTSGGSSSDPKALSNPTGSVIPTVPGGGDVSYQPMPAPVPQAGVPGPAVYNTTFPDMKAQYPQQVQSAYPLNPMQPGMQTYPQFNPQAGASILTAQPFVTPQGVAMTPSYQPNK
jgi:hypothetical protein